MIHEIGDDSDDDITAAGAGAVVDAGVELFAVVSSSWKVSSSVSVGDKGTIVVVVFGQDEVDVPLTFSTISNVALRAPVVGSTTKGTIDKPCPRNDAGT